MQFSLKQILLGTFFVALVVPMLTIPGGTWFFLPILAIAVTGLLAWQLRPRSKQAWKPIAFSLALAAFAGSLVVFLAVLPELSSLYAERRFEKTQRDRALAIEDPVAFRSIALRLHRQITSRPNTQRLLESNSEELPAEILNLNALSVLADDDFLFIKMTPGGAGIVVYPDDSMKAHVQARPLGDSIYYYPN